MSKGAKLKYGCRAPRSEFRTRSLQVSAGLRAHSHRAEDASLLFAITYLILPDRRLIPLGSVDHSSAEATLRTGPALHGEQHCGMPRSSAADSNRHWHLLVKLLWDRLEGLCSTVQWRSAAVHCCLLLCVMPMAALADKPPAAPSLTATAYLQMQHGACLPAQRPALRRKCQIASTAAMQYCSCRQLLAHGNIHSVLAAYCFTAAQSSATAMKMPISAADSTAQWLAVKQGTPSAGIGHRSSCFGARQRQPCRPACLRMQCCSASTGRRAAAPVAVGAASAVPSIPLPTPPSRAPLGTPLAAAVHSLTAQPVKPIAQLLWRAAASTPRGRRQRRGWTGAARRACCHMHSLCG